VAARAGLELGGMREHPRVRGGKRGCAAVREALGGCGAADRSQLLVQLRAGVRECGEARIAEGDSAWAALKFAAASRAHLTWCLESR